MGRPFKGTVIMVVPEPVTDTGLNVAVGPAGWGVIVNVTGRLNPPEAVTVTVNCCVFPCFACPEDAIVKLKTVCVRVGEILPLLKVSPP